MPVGDAAQAAGELRARGRAGGRARGPPVRVRQVRPPSKASSPQRLLGGRKAGAGGGGSHGPVVGASCPGAGPCGRPRLPPSSGLRKRERSPGGRGGPDPGLGGSRPAAAGAAGPPSGAPSRCAGAGAGAGWRPPRPSRTHPAPLRAAPPLRGGRPSAGPGGAGRGEGGGGSRGAPRPQRSPQDAAVEGRAPCPGPAGSPAPAGGGRRRDGEPRGSRRGGPKGEHKSRVRCGTAFPEDAASRVPHLGSQRMPHPTEPAWKRSHDRLQLRAERPGGAFPGFTLKWL